MAKTELIPNFIKQGARNVFRPFAGVLLKTGMTPNTMTVLGVILSLVAAVLFALGHLTTAGITYMLAGFCDIFDGAMARIQGRGSSFGAFLDSTLDRLAEAIALMGVMVYFHNQDNTTMIYITYLAVTSSLLVSYTKARSEGLGQECDVGLLERPERITLVVAGVVFFQEKGLIGAMILTMVLAFFTVGQRMYHTYQGFKKNGKA